MKCKLLHFPKVVASLPSPASASLKLPLSTYWLLSLFSLGLSIANVLLLFAALQHSFKVKSILYKKLRKRKDEVLGKKALVIG